MKKLINKIANVFRKKSEDSNNGSEIYEYHALIKEDGQYKIIWSRDGKSFEYEISETLANKSRKSDKDALEVMFYVEHNRWPQEGELDNYHQVKVKTYRGSLFTIYVEDDKYEIGFESEHGHMNLGDEKFPITKELKEKAFKSYEDAEAVMWYALTGAWLSDGKEEVFRRFFRRFPKFILVNPEKYKGLFSEEEYEHILTVAKEIEEKETEKARERIREKIREEPELILLDTERRKQLFSKEEFEYLFSLAEDKEREYIRENPVNILVYPGRNQRLFSNEEEYNHLVSLAEEQWEKEKGDERYSLKTADDGETRYFEKITLEAIVRNQKARKEYIRRNPESMLESIQEGKDLFLKEEFESILSLTEEREKERKAIRKNPELILEKIEENRKLFLSEEEFNHLVSIAKEKKNS